ncbi:MAG: hypothetical protein AB4206_17665 [Xenococcaceae cyanobacterium]
MNDLERIRDEMITLLVLMLTLAFTSSNFRPESLEKNSSLAEKLLLVEQIN